MNITVQEESKSQLGLFEASTYIIFNIQHKMKTNDDKRKKKKNIKFSLQVMCLH